MKKIDYVPLNESQVRLLVDIFNPEHPDEKIYQRFLAEINSGFALYGKILDASLEYLTPSNTVFDFAYYSRCIPVLLYLYEHAPDLIEQPGSLLAQCRSHPELISDLLSSGITIEDGIAFDDDFLRDFVIDSHPESIKLFVDHGLNLDVTVGSVGIFDEQPAILYATRRSKPAQVIAMIEVGCNLESRDKDGKSFLHSAVPEYWTVSRPDVIDTPDRAEMFRQIISAAVKRGVDIDMVDEAGESALHVAAKMGYTNKAAVLLAFGANLYLRNDKNKTPKQLARERKRFDTARFFTAYEAKQKMAAVIASCKLTS